MNSYINHKPLELSVWAQLRVQLRKAKSSYMYKKAESYLYTGGKKDKDKKTK